MSGSMLRTLNNYFDDLGVGDRFVSRARTVTEADITLFSGLSGDYHPLHTDEIYAQRARSGAGSHRDASRSR